MSPQLVVMASGAPPPKAVPWVTAIDAERPVSGNDLDKYPPRTVGEVLRLAETAWADQPMLVPANPDEPTLTFAAFGRAARRAATAMLAAGLGRFDGVAILGFNAPPWHTAAVGCILAGGVVAGMYPTNSPAVCAHILVDARVRLAFVDSVAAAGKLAEARRLAAAEPGASGPGLTKVVVWGVAAADLDVPALAGVRDLVTTLDEFLAAGDASGVDEAALDAMMATQKPGHCCTLVYTSGTTGPPKGVMISHDNCNWTVAVTQVTVRLGPGDRGVSYLPLSHVAATMIDIHGCLGIGFSMHFARPDALKGSLGETLKAVRPTFFLAIPRVWEKMTEAMLSVRARGSRIQNAISDAAQAVGRAASDADEVGGPGEAGRPWGYALANVAVYRNVRRAMGLDQCKVLVNAAAPLPRPALEYLRGFHMVLGDIYGQSECSGPATVNRPWHYKMGSSGTAAEGVEVKIINVAASAAGEKGVDVAAGEGEGEICSRGRNTFLGYLNNENATQEVLDDEGWLHSGDLGRLDTDGFLWITGRLKELIITAGGENVAPTPIEGAIVERAPELERAFVVGDRRKFLAVLLIVKAKADGTLTGPAKEVDPAVTTAEEVAAGGSEAWKAVLDKAVSGANKVSHSRASRVQKWAVLNRDFSEEEGELTPTLKVKRKNVVKNFESVIEGLYA